MEKRVTFHTWEELLTAAKNYERLGIQVEVRGFQDMSRNVLTVRDELKRKDGSRPEEDLEIGEVQSARKEE